MFQYDPKNWEVRNGNFHSRFTRVENAIFRILWQNMENVVRHEPLIVAMEGCGHKDSVPTKYILYQHIFRIRQKVLGHIRIESYTLEGYRMRFVKPGSEHVAPVWKSPLC